MRILCLSDTHGYFPELDLTNIDLVLHAGDFSFEEKHSYWAQAGLFDNHFVPWANRINDYCPFYFTWGNHEMFAEKPMYAEYNKHPFCLFDREVVVNGYKIYGTPWQPQFCWWAFNAEDTPEGLGHKYSFIPDDVDILLTHCPPYTILDKTFDGELVGSKELCKRIFNTDVKMYPPTTLNLPNLKLNCFGHIHYSYGKMGIDWNGKTTWFVNSSICGEDYKPTRQPIIVEI